MSSSEFEVVHAGREGNESFAPYLYRVTKGGQCVAEISHTHKGDEHFLRRPAGRWEPTDRLVEGGGPQPVRLTPAGAKIIEQLIGD